MDRLGSHTGDSHTGVSRTNDSHTGVSHTDDSYTGDSYTGDSHAYDSYTSDSHTGDSPFWCCVFTREEEQTKRGSTSGESESDLSGYTMVSLK